MSDNRFSDRNNPEGVLSAFYHLPLGSDPLAVLVAEALARIRELTPKVPWLCDCGSAKFSRCPECDPAPVVTVSEEARARAVSALYADRWDRALPTTTVAYRIIDALGYAEVDGFCSCYPDQKGSTADCGVASHRAAAAPEQAGDMVNHPPHYTSHPSGVECITITEYMGFCIGNAIKYLWRADEKGNAIEDLEKARWYIDREIRRRTGGTK